MLGTENPYQSFKIKMLLKRLLKGQALDVLGFICISHKEQVVICKY